MTITIHHLQVSQSDRVVWLAEELGLEYELKLHQRDPVFSPQSIKDLNPLAQAPVMDDDTFGKPVRLAESAAIVEWIVQKHGNGKFFLDKSHPDYADFLYWFHLSNGNLQPLTSRNMAMVRLKDAGIDNPGITTSLDRQKLLFGFINDRLNKVPYLAGEEFTAADIMSVFSFTTMRKFYPYSLEGYDGILAWLKRCADRPAYKKAMQKGDPDLELCIGAQAPELFGPLKK